MAGLRLTQRQWRIYLAVWLSAVAAIAGIAAGLAIPTFFRQPAHPTLGGGLVVAANTIRAPDFSLTDQDGAPVSLSDLHGKVVALTFLDTLCTNVCPLQARLLGAAESDLGPGIPLSVVVVSVRPEADTWASISTFAKANGLTSFRWLTGSRPELAQVWNEYGVAVQPSNGDLQHTSLIYLIDPTGYERVGFVDVPQATAFETDVRILAGKA